MNYRLKSLLSEFAVTHDLSKSQARKIGKKFGYYFAPRWSYDSDRKVLKMLEKVAKLEGIQN